MGSWPHGHRHRPRSTARLRRQFQQPPAAQIDELIRDLADYDKAFGLDTNGITR